VMKSGSARGGGKKGGKGAWGKLFARRAVR